MHAQNTNIYKITQLQAAGMGTATSLLSTTGGGTQLLVNQSNAEKVATRRVFPFPGRDAVPLTVDVKLPVDATLIPLFRTLGRGTLPRPLALLLPLARTIDGALAEECSGGSVDVDSGIGTTGNIDSDDDDASGGDDDGASGEACPECVPIGDIWRAESGPVSSATWNTM
jgi:hypothetical protein